MESPVCRIAELEWDRGHESFTAIVRAASDTGLIVTEVRDLASVPGLRWIRADEITSIADKPADSPALRLADLRGTRAEHLEPALTDLPTLLAHLQAAGALISIYRTLTGSGEMLVGFIRSLSADEVILDEIDTDASRTDETLTYALDEIIGVDWDTLYLSDLAELLAR